MSRAGRALYLHVFCVMAAWLSFGAAEAKDIPSARPGKGTEAHASKAARSQTKPAPTTRLQPAVLRYTSLPRNARKDFHPEVRPPTGELADTPEARCARATSSDTASGNEKVSPCLGLYHGGQTPSAVKFRFDLALKSIGAPKDVFVGQCAAGSPTCNNSLNEAQAEQERLADTLNRQRRYPLATLGVAVSF